MMEKSKSFNTKSIEMANDVGNVKPHSTHHLIDGELLQALDFLPCLDLKSDTLLSHRAVIKKMEQNAELQVSPIVEPIQGLDGTLELFWFDPTPGIKDRPCLLHIHGGGMVLGSVRDMARAASGLATGLNMPVASIEYRLAPETPFPGPQEDCYSALVWLHANSERLGIDRTRIGIAGESAGGGLAAAVTHMSRDRRGPNIAAQILAYPMLDHRVGGPIDPWCNRHTGEFVWTRANNQFGWESLREHYVPQDARKGWFSPSLADDLTGLPPAWIGVGTLDLFFDENLDYARRLVDAGVSVELNTYPGAFHAFNMVAEASLSKKFVGDMQDAAHRLLARGHP